MQDNANDIASKTLVNRVYIVLPEVFGVNAWVRSVADRLAAQGYPALAVPLFSRTAPDLELAYDASDLAEGRRHKDATTSEQIVADVAAAVSWFRARYPQAAIHVVGFCFGGHAAFLAATLHTQAFTPNTSGSTIYARSKGDFESISSQCVAALPASNASKPSHSELQPRRPGRTQKLP